MADWLEPFLSVLTWLVWFFAGVGIPWAYALLPRRDWRDWATVVGLGLALGPLFGTTWLFLLGTFGEFTFGAAVVGTVMIAGVGVAVAWRRWDELPPVENQTDAEMDDLLPRPLIIVLLVMMVLGVLAMAWDTAFWPFLRYDTLWTFGYNAKIFMLEGRIPHWMDYYPQQVPLTFTFGDLAWGSHNDHAARAAVPLFFISSGFAAYLLGWRVYGQRSVGLLTVALWILLPSSLIWSSSGDLEHPMALYFTLATVFFTLAWRAELRSSADRYAAIAGLMLAGAMWTKPTSGAFVLGVGLVMAGAASVAYLQDRRRWFANKLRIVVVTGIFAAPIGGMWYIRNVLYGHAWTILPVHYWRELAQRSGMQLTWLYVLAVLLALILIFENLRRGRNPETILLPMLSITLLSLAILPTALSVPEGGWTQTTAWDWINGFREPMRRLNMTETVLLFAGIAVLLGSMRGFWREQSQMVRQGWLLTWTLGLPFFLVYFWSYSYHYRLALTVLPLIFAPIAYLLTGWVIPVMSQNRLRQTALVIIVFFLCIPAPIAATYHTAFNTFNKTGVNTDSEKYRYANPALMRVVQFLEEYADSQSVDHLRVLAPGENRLHFYFPDWDINYRAIPTDIADLEGYDLYVAVFDDGLWRDFDLIPNQVWAWKRMAWVYPLPPTGQQSTDGPNGVAWRKVFTPVTAIMDDGNNRYEVFKIDTGAVTQSVTPENPLDDVVFDGTMQLLGFDLPSTTLTRGEPFTLKLYWQGTENAPPQRDYSVYVHLLDPDTGEILAQRDGGLMGSLFPTRLLTPGFVLQDLREWTIAPEMRAGPAILRIGVYVPDGPRLPASIHGEAVGDGVVIEQQITIQ
ncbi:MAG: hypothetical protein HY862_13230 [Chloroflexi bacterium]|nr:hypothetical protein [Chloroflexota bacterium]